MKPEYDFSKGVRGKHHKKMSEGFSVTVYSSEDEKLNKQIKERNQFMKIEKDVLKYF